jgi:hypothetical protein
MRQGRRFPRLEPFASTSPSFDRSPDDALLEVECVEAEAVAEELDDVVSPDE